MFVAYHCVIHHQDGDLSVAGPLNLLPHDWVNLHNLIWETMVVQERSHLTAEGARLVLVEGQLHFCTGSRWLGKVTETTNIKSALVNVNDTYVQRHQTVHKIYRYLTEKLANNVILFTSPPAELA